MPTTWDNGLIYDPEIAAALADTPVVNGELARSPWPVTIDLAHAAAMAGLSPNLGVSCLLDTTARQIRFQRPPFAGSARFVVIAAGTGDITIVGSSGGSGTVTISITGDTGVSVATLYQSEDSMSLSTSDVCAALDVSVSRSGSGVQCYAIAPVCDGWTL